MTQGFGCFSTLGTTFWLALAKRASAICSQSWSSMRKVISDWTISTIWSFIVIYYAYIFVYILNTNIDLETLWTNKKIRNILLGSPVCYQQFCPLSRGVLWEERGTRVTHGTWKEVICWDVSLPLIKANWAVFYNSSHVNYILDLFIGGHLNWFFK